MKNRLFGLVMLLSVTIGYAQTNLMNTMSEKTAMAPRVVPDSLVQSATDTTVALLDKAVTAQTAGDKAATAQALQASTNALEAEAKASSGGFKDKLLGQAGSLKKLIPLATSGMLGGGILQKAVGLAKMAFAGNKIEQLMGGASLLSNVGGLTSNLGILKSALPALGGGAASSGGSLITGALGGLSKLSGGGAAATVAEPAVRSQLNSVLSFVKGAI
ncbi:MAG: hypothetical protein H7Z72_13270 [Bacteroidetes bacterium]|nr:hypothetical protein [Fibrella sp.]